MAVIAQGVRGEILRGADSHFIALTQNGAVNRAMGAIRAGTTNLGARVVVMAVGAVNHTGGIQGWRKLAGQTGHVAVASASNDRMEGWGQVRGGVVENQSFIHGVQYSGYDWCPLL